MTPQLGFLFNKAIENLENSNWDTAELFLNQALKIQPNNPHTLGFLAVVYAKREQYVEALEFANRSLKLLPKNALTLSNLGNIYLGLEKFEKAHDAFDKSLKIDQKNPEAWLNKGNALQELKRFEEALSHYDKVLLLQPNSAEAWSNRGNALQELKRFEDSLTHYDAALNIRPNYTEAWSNKGNALQELKRFEEAVAHYDKSISSNQHYAKAYVHKGNALNELKRFEEALLHYEKALSLDSDYAEAYSCKGSTLSELKRFDEAISNHDRSLSLKPHNAAGWLNKGIALSALNRYEDAIACYDKALSLAPDLRWVNGYLIHLRMKIGSWNDLSSSLEKICSKVIANQTIIRPFDLLSISDDPSLHKQAAHIFSQDQFPVNLNLGLIPKHEKQEKIRIAYFSPDFRNHPVSILTAELFEIHDRSRFEVIAFALQKAPIGDEMSMRLKKSFDEFLEVDNLSDREIASLARQKNIDIAIDLAGFTQHLRTGIFSYRAAPIQVSWLGYPGTSGSDFIDYIIVDETIIPNTHREFYSEKIAHLPNSYMVDDSKRIPSKRVFTKDECGLPNAAFIFCCLNNDYKFNPNVLDSWSKILLNTKDSVLWISENNADFRKNIQAEFGMRSIKPERIIFAQRVDSMGDYLARYKLADLFLDTYPYGAHTTALDSLKVGVPLLTLLGKSFPGRVAASLLNAIGLPELITSSQEEYITLAIELANNPNKLAKIKERLVNNLTTTPLFNTPLFTKNIEAIYVKMVERYQKDMKPDHINVD